MLSASEHQLYVTRKVRDYLSAGGQEVWLIDPDNEEVQVRTRTAIHLLQPGDTLQTALLPGFAIAVSVLLDLPAVTGPEPAAPAASL